MVLLYGGVKASSVMSNEDVELLLIPSMRENPNYGGVKERVYSIRILNKSDKTIFIDKGNCFRMDATGNYVSYFSTDQLTETNGKGNFIGLGLGSVAGALGIGGVVGNLANGVSVGGSSSHYVSHSYSQQRIIAIPSKGVRDLCTPNWIKSKGATFSGSFARYETIEDSEVFRLFNRAPLKKGEIKVGETKVYDENDSPISIKYIITYSNSENFSTYSTMKVDLFIHEIIGTSKTIPEFILYGNKANKYIENLDSYTIYGSAFFPDLP